MAELSYYPEPRAVLGEAPVWDPVDENIWWVDCDQKKIFCRDPEPAAEVRTFTVPHAPGSYAFRDKGGMIVAYRNKLALVDLETGEHETIETPDLDFSVERFNDGACDRAGRFWAGTMHKAMKERVGSLYRIDPDLSIRRMNSNLIVSNGISFSPDDRTMYHHDSRSGVIFAYDYDLDRGEIGKQRVFVDFAGRPGRPDGCTIDAEGCLWVAEIGAGRIVRFDRTGRQIGMIETPVTRPSSVMFGGADLSTLFITTMRHGLPPEEMERQSQAGCLFYTKVDVPGLPEPRFAG